jgi:hypothetical protein
MYMTETLYDIYCHGTETLPDVVSKRHALFGWPVVHSTSAKKSAHEELLRRI